MVTIQGVGVYGATAEAQMYLYKKTGRAVEKTKAARPGDELRRFAKARKAAKAQLRELYQKALEELGESEAGIFDIHGMMLEDGDYLAFIEELITQRRYRAAHAVQQAGQRFADMFAAMEDEYMRARAVDVVDISDRIVDNLLGGEAPPPSFEKPVIVVARDLTPSETLRMDKIKVAAFVTLEGSGNSHTAILARTLGIPAVVGCNAPALLACHGKPGAVDGAAGLVYIEPDAVTLERLRRQQARRRAEKAELQSLAKKPAQTKDGKAVRLYANIGAPGDVNAALEGGAEGIGLFRSEFLYLERQEYPTEEEQFAAYREVLERMEGKPVVIRTMDIGADKQAAYLNLPPEPNPALGCRGIRLCLARPQVFETQLRALLRASAFGRLAILVPMVVGVQEVLAVKEMLERLALNLEAEGEKVAPYEFGVMVETPAAALTSDLLAPHVDFFSIGTNDLTQYTLAADRQNPALAGAADPQHPAIFRLIELVCQNAKAAGIWVGVCGELAADTTATERLLRLGVQELSVSPPYILPLKKAVCEAEISGICSTSGPM